MGAWLSRGPRERELTLVNRTAFTVALDCNGGRYLCAVRPGATETCAYTEVLVVDQYRYWSASGWLPGLDDFTQELGVWDNRGMSTAVIHVGPGGCLVVLDHSTLAVDARALLAILRWQRGFRARSLANMTALMARLTHAAVQIQRIARGACARVTSPCAICYDDVPLRTLARPARACRRAADHRFCVRCVRTHIDIALTSGRLYVRCPGGDCGAFVERAAFTTYGSLAAVAAYVEHLAAGHAERLAHEEDRAFVAFCAAETRRCPGCAVLIWRAGGCDHMTCVCGREFQYDAAEAKVPRPEPATGGSGWAGWRR
jgi:hypothetical protein